eukprot:7388695-Prymnesium_polylepis.1
MACRALARPAAGTTASAGRGAVTDCHLLPSSRPLPTRAGRRRWRRTQPRRRAHALVARGASRALPLATGRWTRAGWSLS